MDDKILRQHIIDALDWEPAVDSANIGVAVNKGIVTLTGHVPSYAQVFAAERAVKHVKGVQGIAQEMEVRFAGAPAHSDEDIAGRAVAMLKWSIVVPKDAVKVKVAKGWITLSGEVEWDFQRRAAETNLHGLAGVMGVINLIQVKPNTTAGDVTKGIEAAFKRDADLEAHRIKVSVTDGKVRLEGAVHSWRERDAADRAAWAAPGVRTVEDHILIG